jgi:hypothetical protein
MDDDDDDSPSRILIHEYTVKLIYSESVVSSSDLLVD